jgi:hypothetical protein
MSRRAVLTVLGTSFVAAGAWLAYSQHCDHHGLPPPPYYASDDEQDDYLVQAVRYEQRWFDENPVCRPLRSR